MKPSERIKELATKIKLKNELDLDGNHFALVRANNLELSFIEAILEYLDEQRELENQRIKDILQGKNL